MLLAAFGVAMLLAASAVIAVRSHTDATAALMPSFRPTIARVTSWQYVPFRSVRRGAGTDWRTEAELNRRRLAATTVRNAANLHRYALATLANGAPAEAVALLAEAHALEPENTEVLADLGAAQLADDRAADAAETSAIVLQHDPSNAAAAFNRGLALEMLSNRPAAVAAWEQYLALDKNGGWADEALAHLNWLNAARPDWQRDRIVLESSDDEAAIRRIVEAFPHRTRNWIYDDWLPRYLATKTPRDLARARMIAGVRGAAGERFLDDFIDSVSNGASDRSLADGLAAFTAARAAGDRRDIDAAATAFAKAAALLERARCPLALIAQLFAATNDFYRGRSDAAIARLDGLDANLSVAADRYPSIAAESLWVRGLVFARLGRPNESLEAYEAGIARARSCRDIEDEVAISALIASVLDRVGDPEEAQRYRREVLRRFDETGATDQRAYSAYLFASYTELGARRPRVALAFIDTQSLIADREKDALLLAETAALRALALRDLARYDAANRSVSAARQHALAIPNAALKDRVSSDIAYVEGTMPGVAPQRAIAILTTAVDTWRRYHWRIRSASGLLARGEAYLRAGDRVAAEADFLAGIAEMEEQREELVEPDFRAAYFERADLLFERLIALWLDENRPADALSIAERKRARALLDRIASAAGARATVAEPADATSIAARVPAGTAIVEYALLDDAIAIWTIADKRISFERVPVARAAVDGAVRQHVDAVLRDDAAVVHKEGRWLFDHLLAGLASRGATATTVIVPDGSLYTLPFATLVSPDGRYAVESYSFVTAPSASVFLDLHAIPAGAGHALVVAQPDPPNAKHLPAAAREARDVAASYANAELHIGNVITPQRFLELAANAAMIHFAGHALADKRRGARSALLFESHTADDLPRVEAKDIAASHLRARPLVVLAACGTAEGTLRRNEGVESLATAFIYAGARNVVASMWDVDDSSRLFAIFHANRRAGQPAAGALRNAQRSLLAGNNAADRLPSVWGAPVLIGDEQ